MFALLASCVKTPPKQNLTKAPSSTQNPLWPKQHAPAVFPPDSPSQIITRDRSDRLTSIGIYGTSRVYKVAKSKKTPYEEYIYHSVITNSEVLDTPLIPYGADYFSGVRLFPSHRANAKGLMLYLTSAHYDSFPENRLIKTFNADGWHVAQINHSAHLLNKKYTLAANIDAPERDLAAAIDRDLSQRIFAAESMFAFLQKTRPQWHKLPRIIVASSLGSLSAPTTIKRLGNFKGAILLGAGHNTPGILRQTSLFNYKLEGVREVTRDGTFLYYQRPIPITKAQRDAAFTNALPLSQLEAGTYSSVFASMPTLVVHGRFDRIIPKPHREILYDRLPTAEHWKYPLGHNLLFVTIGYTAGDLLRWVDANIDLRKDSVLR